MALKEKVLFSPFVRGVDEQSDAFQLNSPTVDEKGKTTGVDLDLISAENVSFDSLGKVNSKPLDFQRVTGVYKDATAIESDGDSLFRFDGNKFFELSGSVFENKGDVVPVNVEKQFVSSNADNNSYLFHNNIHYVASERLGAIELNQLDENLKKIRTTIIQSNSRFKPYLISYGNSVFVACFNGQIVYVYTDAGDLIYSRNLGASVLLTKGYDRFLFFSVTGGGLMYADFLNNGSPQTIYEEFTPTHFDFHYNEPTDDIVFFIALNDRNLMKSVTLNRTSGVVTDSDENIEGITGQIPLSTENGDVLAFGKDSFMMRYSDGTFIKKGNKFRKIVGLSPYYVVSENLFVVYSGNGYFLLDFELNSIGRFNGSLIPFNRVIFQTGFSFSNNGVIPSIESFRLQSERAVLFTENRISLARVLESDNFFDVLRIKNSTIISGSVLSLYDGNQITELGFNQAPEISSVSEQNLSANASSFLYVAIYTWGGSDGNFYRSRASNLIRLSALISEEASQEVILKVSNLNLTNKKNVNIEIYRTDAGLTNVYYKVKTLQNITDQRDQDFTDNVNSLAAGNEQLYISGGIVSNAQSEGGRFLRNYNAKVYVGRTTDDKKKIDVSKSVSEFAVNGVEFSGQSSIFLPEDITGLEVMDDKLIIFTENNIYFYTENLSEPEHITGSTNVGCSDLGALVLDINGIYFKSKKGVYLLNRGLSLVFIGYSANVSLSDKILKCINSSEKREIYFLTESGAVVVFNTFFNNFTTFNSKIVKSMTSYDGKLHLLDSQNKIYYQDDTESDVEESFLLETGWIQFAQIMNSQRIKEIYILGDIENIESMTLDVAYDYQDADIFSQTISREEINQGVAFNSGDVFGSDKVFGLVNNRKTYRFYSSVQKCSSLKVKIRIRSRQGFSLSGIGFKYAIKKGLTRQRTFKGA